MKSSQLHQAVESKLLDFFVDELKDIYWAEKHLIPSLKRLEKAATSPELKQAFVDHQRVTEVHVDRLEKVFQLLEEKAVAKKCDAMNGIIEEAKGIIEDTEEGTMIRDVALILAAQKAEHYEIATYGGLATLAKQLKKMDVAELLGQTLREEKETDSLLSSIAEGYINEQAAEE